MQTHPLQGKPETARKEQNIACIRQMLGELGTDARSENADMLDYLIETAHLEAGDILAGSRPESRVEKPL